MIDSSFTGYQSIVHFLGFVHLGSGYCSCPNQISFNDFHL